MNNDPRAAERAVYVAGYGDVAHRYMLERSAVSVADFLLPHLVPGMRLLDVGCGPGTITLDLAELVAPGEVIGVDQAPVQLERARALATERGISSVRFEQADLFALPYADASFDVVFAHAVLMHVGDRLAALHEFRRVLRPGGIVAVKDLQTGEPIIDPATPLLRDFFALLNRAKAKNGVPISAPETYRALLREAGFVDVEASASCKSHGTAEAVRTIAAMQAVMARGEVFQQTVVEQGWADQAHLDAIVAEIERWGEDPDAFRVELFCAALGRVPRLYI